ncbi:V-set and immunoglobulin domain-containing protein 8b isoform X1 [Polyodon spathula]|uniref:V-set and immunoglobulin domain-containing protein 8b isoform X1 n=2 Tax=Polyodon spathula TaxID=7913 RepID=UPI001B7E3155|nr:V-set and immunoglobulin domain-containing protein 8b isoform X1 [Polyodon spathula]XP_041089306.1 V-set and immunoglobulin domain-containing protein 8b isoform X1 [Polyodon spathula]XP_041089307.1 V-set and immunoglobulin domain-containing protein 8b isoform X1 [Polyodon spathula]
MDVLCWRKPGVCSRKLLMVLSAMYLSTDITVAMKVTSIGPQTVRKARGGTVVLGCTFIADVTDRGELDIEWSNMNPDTTQKDEQILGFSGGEVFHYGSQDLSKRLNFTDKNPALGDASISITDLELGDTSTYQCKVKKMPGIDTRKVTLVVEVPPSVPRCSVEGGQDEGHSVSLSCKSDEGMIPLTYKWGRESGEGLPPTAIQNPGTGILLIQNHTKSFSGSYRCTVRNAVGEEQCVLSLGISPSVNKAGMIAGAVIGSLLLLLLLLLLIWLLICCCNKRRYQKEVANEIREDVAPPVSRSVTPNASVHSSFRSILGYRSHPIIGYHYQRANHRDIYKGQLMDSNKPSNNNLTKPGGVPVMTSVQNREAYAV